MDDDQSKGLKFPAKRIDRLGKEVAGDQAVHVHLDKRPPRRGHALGRTPVRVRQQALGHHQTLNGTSAGGQGEFTQLTDDPADASIGVLPRKPKDQFAHRRGNLPGATDLAGGDAGLRLAEPALIGLDTDDADEIICHMPDRLAEFEQPRPFLRRHDHPVARQPGSKDLDLRHHEPHPGVAAGRIGLDQQVPEQQPPRLNHDSDLRPASRKSSTDNSPTLWAVPGRVPNRRGLRVMHGCRSHLGQNS